MEKTVTNDANLFTDEDFVQEGDRACLGTYTKWSWDLAWHKGYAGKYFVIFLIMFGIGIVTALFDGILSLIIGKSNIITDIVAVILSVGLLGFSINLAKGFEQKVGDFFREITWERIWKIFYITIVISIIICICGALLVFSLMRESGVDVVLLVLGIISLIFGLFLCIKLGFAPYAVVNKGCGPNEALVYSRNITKGHFWEIVLFGLYFVAINILGMFCLFVGLVWTGAMTYTATAKYYLILSGLYENGSMIRKE